MVHPRRFPELEARPGFAAARISVVVTGGSRAERSDAVTCGFPHRPRLPYRRAGPCCCTGAMLSYEDIILLGEERVLVIQEHEDGRCWCGETWDWPAPPSHPSV